MNITAYRIPTRIANHALRIIHRYRCKEVRPRRTYQHKYLTFKVTPGYRLLSKDNGHNWELMSHEKYNKELKI